MSGGDEMAFSWDAQLRDQADRALTLGEAAGGGPALIVFLRGDW